MGRVKRMVQNTQSVENETTNKKITQNVVDIVIVVLRNRALMLMYTLKIDVQTAIKHALIH